MLDAVGHPVVELVRRRFGPLHLGTLAPGEVRDLTKVELGLLLTIAREAETSAPTGAEESPAGTKPAGKSPERKVTES
jgi:hypothetical protein